MTSHPKSPHAPREGMSRRHLMQVAAAGARRRNRGHRDALVGANHSRSGRSVCRRLCA